MITDQYGLINQYTQNNQRMIMKWEMKKTV